MDGGANPNVHYKMKETPLWTAANHENIGATQALIDVLDIPFTKFSNVSGKCFVFSSRIIFCFGVFGVFVFFSGARNVFRADFIFYDFTFSFATGGARRKMQNRKK